MRFAAVLRTTGEVLITLGVVVLLFVAYELWVTDLRNAGTQRRLHQQLTHTWQAPAAPRTGQPVTIPAVSLGQGLGVLHIPRFGRGYDPVIVEGVSTADLQEGPGHYPGTALPGQVGNFVVSGHRTTYGHPFNRLDELRPGDAVVVETRDAWFTYTVTSLEVVDPTDVAVILPVPDRPGQRPTERLLTFTTCNPKYSAAQRLVLHGRLTAAVGKPAPAPAALSGV